MQICNRIALFLKILFIQINSKYASFLDILSNFFNTDFRKNWNKIEQSTRNISVFLMNKTEWFFNNMAEQLQFQTSSKQSKKCVL